MYILYPDGLIALWTLWINKLLKKKKKKKNSLLVITVRVYLISKSYCQFSFEILYTVNERQRYRLDCMESKYF